VRHVVIGTAGHVDHGKTTLVHALTGVQTDRLPEEQRRGITIELGFAPWRIADDMLVSIIDAPGHRKLVHHMIAGASGIDMVMLVIAGDEGVMPQTREHIAACRLLGVQRAIVAVTKIDRVDAELAELAGEEARELLEGENIRADVVLCSGKSGEGIEALKEAVLAALRETEPEARERRVRLSVDRVFTVKGAGTVVTGTLVDGAIDVGDTLRILGPERELSTSARGLHVHGDSCDHAAAPTRLAINLGGVALDDVHRGDVITSDAHVQPTRVVDVWLDVSEPPRRGAEASIFVGTARSTAKIQPVEGSDEKHGVLARLRLGAPLVTFGGDRFVLRGAKVDGPAGAVFGGGVVLDAQPPRRGRASKRLSVLQALHHGDAAAACRALAAETSPPPLLRRTLPSRLAITAADLEKAANTACSDGELIAVGDEGWLLGAALTALEQQATQLVGDHHQSAPLEPGLRLQTLRERLASIAGTEATALAIARLTTGDDAPLVIEGDSIRLASFGGIEQNPEAMRALDKVRGLMRNAALQGMSEHALIEQNGGDPKTARTLLALMARRAEAIKCGDLWFDAGAVDGLEKKVRSHLDENDKLTIQDFKTMTGLGRKQTIPLLEHFDRSKVTRRDGSDRVKA
jgi:selenocysteine-specific elongation factor